MVKREGILLNTVFQDLYDKYHQDIFNFLFYMVKNREQAEDLVQEVYIKVLKSYDRFQGNSSEKTWLFSIARHVAIDFYRKQNGWRKRLATTFDWSKQQVKDCASLPEEIVIQNDEINLMYKCLDHCTTDQRLVLILRYIQSLSIIETADALGWTQSKVKTTQHRALKVLKKYMEESSGKEDMIDEKFKVE